MKNTISRLIPLTLILSLLLTACGSSDVKVELPEFLAVEEFGEDMDKESLEDDERLEKVDIKDNGSIVISMSKGEYDRELKHKKERIDNAIKSLTANEEFTFVDDVKFDKEYKKIDILVDKSKLDETPEFTVYIAHLVGLSAYSYQTYAEKSQGSIINFIDSSNNEVIDSLDFPEDFKSVLGIEDK